MKRSIFIALLVFGAASCEDDTLGDEHYFLDDGVGFRMIRSKNMRLHETTIYPDVTSHAANSDFIIAKQVPNAEAAKRHVADDLYMKYKYLNRTYLDQDTSVRRQPVGKQMSTWDSLLLNTFLVKGASVLNSAQDHFIKEQIADSLLSNDVAYTRVFKAKENYWIIDKRENKLIGPMTKKEYQSKRVKLSIPSNLALED